MRDFILILVICAFIFWGYHLMGRLDRFMNTWKPHDEDENHSGPSGRK